MRHIPIKQDEPDHPIGITAEIVVVEIEMGIEPQLTSVEAMLALRPATRPARGLENRNDAQVSG